jgi:hypothetical protein
MHLIPQNGTLKIHLRSATKLGRLSLNFKTSPVAEHTVSGASCSHHPLAFGDGACQNIVPVVSLSVGMIPRAQTNQSGYLTFSIRYGINNSAHEKFSSSSTSMQRAAES